MAQGRERALDVQGGGRFVMVWDPVFSEVCRVATGVALCKVGLHSWKEVWRCHPTKRLVFVSVCGPIFGTEQLVGHKCRRCGVRK